jgi:hypothetical protein
VNTFEPYQKEVALQLLPDQKEIIQSTSGIQYILESLTPTDVSLLKLIATLQLEKLASTSTSTSTSSIQQQTLGTHVLDYQRIYDLARKKLILTTALGMRNALKCLEEHFLIKKIRIKNEEKIFVPFPEHIIQTAILQQVN